MTNVTSASGEHVIVLPGRIFATSLWALGSRRVSSTALRDVAIAAVFLNSVHEPLRACGIGREAVLEEQHRR